MASIRSSRVVVYHADGCHLCERALAQVRALHEELGFELEEIAIDGARAFTYHVHEDAFRRRLA